MGGVRILALGLAGMVLVGQGAPTVAEAYTKREVLIPMRDGTRLFTSIYAPRDRSRTYPILLNRTPYSVAPYGPEAFRPELGPSAAFAKEGFIFVYQDVRGRFMSEGAFVDLTPHRPAKGPKDVDESTDTFDTVAWLLANVQGHNGRVGQWGISYPGFYTAAGMLDAHPALVAVSPQAPIVDWFEGDDFRRNGAFWLPHLFNFIWSFGQVRHAPTTEWPARFDHGTSDGYDFFLRLGPLRNAELQHFKGRIPFWTAVMAHGTYDSYWKARNLRPHVRNVKPAVLVVGGWFDAENLFGTLRLHETLRAQSPGTDARLVMGPWVHGGWEWDPGERVGDVRWGARTAEAFQSEVLFPWFMHHLKGAPAPSLQGARVFETGANRWHDLKAWPPAATATRAWFQPGGRLGWAAPPPAVEAFLSDPAKPVPFMEGVHIGMTPEYMTADQRFAGRRPDVLVFRTEPLAEDLTLAGPIRVHLEVSTTGTDADWVVKVIDVYPDDTQDPEAKPPAGDGEFPRNHLGGYQQLVRGEVMRGKFRKSLERPEPFTPGQATAVAWRINDLCHTWRKGHRLMVQVQSSWFPLMDRNPQTFCDIHTAGEEAFRKAEHRLHLGAGSYLELPVWKP